MILFSELANKVQRQMDRRKPKKADIHTELTDTAIQEPIDTLVFAHRGSKFNRPENTLASFREAVRVHADGIELDVHLSADGELIVIHDEKIDRTTDGKGLVRKYTSVELLHFDAGRWFKQPEFYGERIPTLPQVLQTLEDLHFTGVLNIEIKTDKFHYPGIEKKLSTLMASHDWPFSYLYSSFNLTSLKMMSVLEPDSELSYLSSNRLKKIATGEVADFISALHPRKTYLSRHPYLATSSSKPIRLWTVNRESEMIAAFRANAAGLITDYPEKAIKIREQLKKQS